MQQRAIEIVQGAIEADKKSDYEEAYKLYSNALDYFMLALKCMSDAPRSIVVELTAA